VTLFCDPREMVVASTLNGETRVARPGARDLVRPEPARQEKRCRCGHGKPAHQHYRRGTDCALCACASFSRPWLRVLGLGA
jgi:hypothetical protein